MSADTISSPIERFKLEDRGGSYHRTFWDKMRVTWKLKSRQIRHGINIVLRPHVDIRLCENAILEIGSYCFIDSYVCFMLSKPEPTIVIEDFVGIGRGTIIAAKKSIRIGAYTQIGPFCQINDQGHSFEANKLIMNQPAILKPVDIGKDCWFGSGSRILMGVTIGDGSIIGAGSVVTKDIPAYEIWAGVPARFIKKRT